MNICNKNWAQYEYSYHLANSRENWTVLRRPVVAGLEPSGRQIDVAARWQQSLGAGAEIGLGASWTLDPGHVAGAEPDLTLAAGWRLAF